MKIIIEDADGQRRRETSGLFDRPRWEQQRTSPQIAGGFVRSSRCTNVPDRSRGDGHITGILWSDLPEEVADRGAFPEIFCVGMENHTEDCRCVLRKVVLDCSSSDPEDPQVATAIYRAVQ